MTSAIYSPSVINVNEHGRPVLDDVAWDDFVIQGSALRDIGARVPSWAALFGTTIYAWQFSWNAASPEELHFSAQLPHTWKPGTTVYPHVHWALTAAGAGVGAENVQWDIDYLVQDPGGQYAAGVTTVQSTAYDAQNDAIRDHIKTHIPAAGIDLTGYEESCVLMCRLRRLTSIGNDYQHDVALLSVDLHIEINSMGTDDRTQPWSK